MFRSVRLLLLLPWLPCSQWDRLFLSLPWLPWLRLARRIPLCRLPLLFLWVLPVLFLLLLPWLRSNRSDLTRLLLRLLLWILWLPWLRSALRIQQLPWLP